jgi:Domain of unknown function (DUF1844)
MADQKQDESFRVVDRRLFTAEGELRKEAIEQERQDALEEEKKAAKATSTTQSANKGAIATEAPSAAAAAAPAPDTAASTAPAPAVSRGFQILVDFLAGNAAARLGMLPDPRTGQGFLDLEGANELIEMLDALLEKTRGNLAHEDEQLLLEVLRSLKLSYLEMTKAASQAVREEAKRKA